MPGPSYAVDRRRMLRNRNVSQRIATYKRKGRVRVVFGLISNLACHAPMFGSVCNYWLVCRSRLEDGGEDGCLRLRLPALRSSHARVRVARLVPDSGVGLPVYNWAITAKTLVASREVQGNNFYLHESGEHREYCTAANARYGSGLYGHCTSVDTIDRSMDQWINGSMRSDAEAE
jgi:hypothetical protein